MNPLSTLAQTRILQLTQTLTDLRERVREAVATEMGRAIGDAVRDLLAAVLHRRPSLPDPRSWKPRASSRRPDRARDDPWNDESEWEDPHHPDEDLEEPDFPSPKPAPPVLSPTTRWSTAVTMGAAVAHWGLQRKMSMDRLLTLGMVTAVITLTAGTILQSSFSALDIARELLAVF